MASKVQLFSRVCPSGNRAIIVELRVKQTICRKKMVISIRNLESSYKSVYDWTR